MRVYYEGPFLAPRLRAELVAAGVPEDGLVVQREEPHVVFDGEAWRDSAGEKTDPPEGAPKKPRPGEILAVSEGVTVVAADGAAGVVEKVVKEHDPAPAPSPPSIEQKAALILRDKERPVEDRMLALADLYDPPTR